VPRIIEYPIALETLEKRGFVCNYFNGGAFGFPKGVDVTILGWIATDDPTIRPQLRSHIRIIPPPAEENMAGGAMIASDLELPGPAWIMPLSHWAFELDFGSKKWLPELIQSIDIDPQLLASRSDASHIEFEGAERTTLMRFVQKLLEQLTLSDFMLAFPPHPILCTIHHHKQLWWVSPDETLIRKISGNTPI